MLSTIKAVELIGARLPPMDRDGTRYYARVQFKIRSAWKRRLTAIGIPALFEHSGHIQWGEYGKQASSYPMPAIHPGVLLQVAQATT